MDYEQQYHAAKAELAEMRQAFKNYMAGVAEAEGVYFVDFIEDARSKVIAETLLAEVRAEDDSRHGRIAAPTGSAT